MATVVVFNAWVFGLGLAPIELVLAECKTPKWMTWALLWQEASMLPLPSAFLSYTCYGLAMS